MENLISLATLSVKVLDYEMFLNEISYAHQSCVLKNSIIQ